METVKILINTSESTSSATVVNTATSGSTEKPTKEWVWQAGPNHRCQFTFSVVDTPPSPPPPATNSSISSTQNNNNVTDSILKSLDPSSLTLMETWFTNRDGTEVVNSDGWLEPNKDHLKLRYSLFTKALNRIDSAVLNGGSFRTVNSMDTFTRGYEYYGFTRGYGLRKESTSTVSVTEDSTNNSRTLLGIWYREWAPGAVEAWLEGDFNQWKGDNYAMKKDNFGVFSIFLPDNSDGTEAIPHNSYLKLKLRFPDNSIGYRVPAWIRYAVYDKALNEYVGKYWNPPLTERHSWKYTRPYSSVIADYSCVPKSAPYAVPSLTNWIGNIRPLDYAKLPAHYRKEALQYTPSNVSSLSSVPQSNVVTSTSVSNNDPAIAGLRVYEAHVGMSSVEEKVSTYREFADNVLPRIHTLGYNCVQLMAIMEHAYYGSFGYHVNQFLAPSSRFGTPEDLKYLVDKAHELGLLIIMDCVHSHANKNINDGINMFDGTDYQYFHSGSRGNHDLWDSRLFDYNKLETQRLLLSSLRLFTEEFRFDGFRFDGVTSMMYVHHGLSYGFSGDYREYFGDLTDLDAVVYLMLANYLLHTLQTPALSIAEDVSGMPTLCRPVWEGGVGFDYRLGMAIPDKWIQFLKEKSDDEWNMDELTWTLINRRYQEKTITYAESHDQALVGDKTIAFWLMDKEMYWHMSSAEHPRHSVIDRGLALHKMIRLLTYGLGGEGYLNFMGNEFGHPEWIDFPRIGNNWSYAHCRRQWNLVDDDSLLYKPLAKWDGAMHHLENHFPWLVTNNCYVSTKNSGDKVIVFDRWTKNGPLVFIFNFHPTQSFTDYRIGVPCTGEWIIAIDSDEPTYAGYNRLSKDTVYTATNDEFNGRPASLQVYSPSRTVIVLKLKTK